MRYSFDWCTFTGSPSFRQSTCHASPGDRIRSWFHPFMVGAYLFKGQNGSLEFSTRRQGILLIGIYLNPYYWVDDHLQLKGTNGSLDPITLSSQTFFLGVWEFVVFFEHFAGSKKTLGVFFAHILMF